jgi:hypothetical protein
MKFVILPTSRVTLAVVAVCLLPHCGDAGPTTPPTPTCAYPVQVVSGPGQPRPLAGATVHLVGRMPEQTRRVTTNDQGFACIDTTGIAGPYTVSAFKVGHTATTIVRINERVQGAIRLEPIVQDTRAARNVPVTLENLPAGTTQVIVTGFDVERVQTRDMTANIQMRTQPDLPLVLNAMAFDGRGGLLNFTSQNLGDREAAASGTTFRFGQQPTAQTSQIAVDFTPDDPAVRTRPRSTVFGALRYFRGAYGSATTLAGYVIERTELLPVLYETKSFAEQQPDGIALIFEDTTNNTRIDVWSHVYNNYSAFTVATPRRFSLAVNRGMAVINYAGSNWPYAAIYYGRTSSIQALWRVIYPNFSSDIISTPVTLPEGITREDLGLTEENADYRARLIKMHEGTPWSIIPEMIAEPEYEVTITTQRTTSPF